MGKTNTSSRSSRKNFWRRFRGDLHQAYQVPTINSHLLHYIICHLPLAFISPTSKTFSEKYKNICLFIRPSSVRLFVCLYVLLGSFACLVGIIVYLLKIREPKIYGSSSTWGKFATVLQTCALAGPTMSTRRRLCSRHQVLGMYWLGVDLLGNGARNSSCYCLSLRCFFPWRGKGDAAK